MRPCGFKGPVHQGSALFLHVDIKISMRVRPIYFGDYSGEGHLLLSVELHRERVMCKQWRGNRQQAYYRTQECGLDSHALPLVPSEPDTIHFTLQLLICIGPRGWASRDICRGSSHKTPPWHRRRQECCPDSWIAPPCRSSSPRPLVPERMWPNPHSGVEHPSRSRTSVL